MCSHSYYHYIINLLSILNLNTQYLSETYQKKTMWYAAILFTILSLSKKVNSEFGDFVDPTFNCPAVTTCPVVCVQDKLLCPSNMTCPSGTDLCADGTCVKSSVGCDPELESPCSDNACGNVVTCAKIKDYYDICYKNATECEDDSGSDVVPWSAPGFVVCYLWIGAITIFIIAFCACNQRFYPVGKAEPLMDASKMLRYVEKSKRDLVHNAKEIAETDVESDTSENGVFSEEIDVDVDWTQTAYKKTFVGDLLYYSTVLTMWGFQVLLLLTTLWFYATELERYDLTPITDTVQVLFAFQLVWMVGFVWCLSLKWPSR